MSSLQADYVEPEGRGLMSQIGLPLGPLACICVLSFCDLDPDRPEVTATAAVALLMAVWWITEALPLAVTSMVPIVLFPALGVLNGKAVAGQYFNHIVFLFLGGFIVALAMQRWNLHRRIALRMLLLFGTKPSRILLGFMITNAFLSMWIANVAATTMMVAIALPLLDRIEGDDTNPSAKRFSVGMLIGVAYSATIGGIATLVGTPPNLSFTRIFEIQFENAPEISFLTWTIFAAPISAIFLVIAWLFLCWMFVPRDGEIEIDPSLIASEYRALGKMSFAEKIVLADFALLVVLWLSRRDITLGDTTIPGWSGLFAEPKFLNDGTAAVAAALLLFAIPARDGKGNRVMNWATAVRLPWNIILLFGGGFALAFAFGESGLADWIGQSLKGLGDVHPFLLLLIICVAISFLTELTSNTATTEMILPIMAGLSVAIDKNPLFLMVAVTLSCSCAFMMPVATPPNAIVFGSGRIRVIQMVRTGLLLNFVGAILILAAMYLLGGAVFGIDLNVMPEWAKK